jgi:AbiU2
MIARLEPDKRIPEELRETYAHLAGSLMWTDGAFEELMFLFGTSENVHFLNETVPAFFVRHQELLIDDIVLSLSRMTDERQSGFGKNRQENLTLARLLDLQGEQCQQLRTELEKRLTKIRDTAKQLRTYRHKRLAHSDLAHLLSPSTKLGDIGPIKDLVDQMKALLDQISDFLGAFEFFFTRVETTSYSPPRSYGDAEDLIAYLKLAVETENKAKNEALKAADEASAGIES